MKRIPAYIALLFFTSVYVIATVPDFTKEVFKSGILKHPRDFGDLYYLSGLHDFKSKVPVCAHHAQKLSSKKKLKFFVIGDSFTMYIPDSSFSSDEYLFTHWDDQSHVILDSSYTNILLIESVEREVMNLFMNEQSGNIVAKQGGKGGFHLQKLYRRTPEMRFNRYFFGNGIIEEDIQLLLFSGPVFRPLTELKAYLNLHLFGRLDRKVSMSKNMHVLYYKMEAARELKSSSFDVISDDEVSVMVENMNRTSNAYRKMGFDNVLFSMIPNKVSILEPGTNYNHLLERIQSHANRRFEVIDAYSMLRQMGSSAYLFNDTHWACSGRNLWLDTVNAHLDAKP